MIRYATEGPGVGGAVATQLETGYKNRLGVLILHIFAFRRPICVSITDPKPAFIAPVGHRWECPGRFAPRYDRWTGAQGALL